MKNKYPDLNEQQEILVAQLWNEENGEGQIALALGVSYSPVKRVIKKLGLRRTPEQRESMLKNLGRRNAIKIKALKKS